MSHPIRFFVLCILASVVITTTLFIYSGKDDNQKNGFERSLAIEKALLKARLRLDPEYYAIAGFNGDSVVLFNLRRPAELLSISLDSLQQRPLHLPFPTEAERTGGVNTVGFIRDTAVLLNGMSSTAYRLSADQKVLDSSKIDRRAFYQSVVMGPGAFLLMSAKAENGVNRRVLKLMNWQGKVLRSYMPDMQVDGYFCTDGQFAYDEQSKALVYVFYYRGELLRLDSDLKPLYKARTIDTVRHAKLSLQSSKVSLNGRLTEKLTTTGIPRIVNRLVSVTAGHVYVNSNLKADNEPRRGFGRDYAIDVYRLSDGKYKGSFYLPGLERQKLTQFKVYRGMVVALYKNTLAVFSLPGL